MELFIILSFIFICGLFWGSFLLVVAERVVEKRPFLFNRSTCDNCGHLLSPRELIPLLSYVLQGGKCRHCHIHLSIWYPLAELITASALVLTLGFHLMSPLPLLMTLVTIVSCLLIIFFADREFGIIPFPIVVLGMCAALVMILLTTPNDFITHIISGLGACALFLCVFLITRGRGMGFGDVVFAFFMGFLLGFPEIIVGLYIAFISGALISLVLVALKKKRLKGGTIPFGPFLVLGTFIMLIAGKEVTQVIMPYLGLL